MQLYCPVMKDYGTSIWHLGKPFEELGVINQKGLGRKVRSVCPSVADRNSG